MDCKRTQELIVPFVNEQLNDAEEMKAFLEHIDGCAECREELEVNYSLMTALKQLDEDTDLSDDYIAELNDKMEACYLDGLKQKRSCVRRRVLIAVLLFLLLFLNGTSFLPKRSEEDMRFFRRIAGMEEMEQKSELSVISETEEEGQGAFDGEQELSTEEVLP